MLTLLALSSCAPDPFSKTRIEQLSSVNGFEYNRAGTELYTTQRQVGPNGKEHARLFVQSFLDNRWTTPTPLLPWADYDDYQPRFSIDQRRLYFTSTRALHGSTIPARQNVWYVDIVAGGPSEPQPLTALISDEWDGHAIELDERTLLFASSREGGKGGTDIWSYDLKTGSIRNAHDLNSPHGDSDMVFSRTHCALLFSRYVEQREDMDIWISLRHGQDWSDPQLVEEASWPGWEVSPSITPDDRWFFVQHNGETKVADLRSIIANYREKSPKQPDC